MKKILVLTVIIFVILFILMSIINLINGYKILTKKGKKRKKEKAIISIKYLKLKFNLKEKRMLNRRFILFISFVDSLIISVVFMMVSLIHVKLILQLVIGFILLLGLIYSIYEIIGRILVKGGYQDEL